MIKKCLSIIIAVIITISFIISLPITANAQEAEITSVGSDDYPYRGGAIDVADEWNMLTRECTSFCAWRLNNNNGVAFHNYFGGVHWGNAGNWGYAAQSIGITVDMNPAIGAIAWWSGGHVAWVSGVSGENVDIEEYNSPAYSYNYNARTINKYNVTGYIHIKDIPDNLKVNVSGSQAYFNWDWDGNADYYNVKLWRNKVWEGDPYRIVWSVKNNNYAFALPKGTYQAYVDSCNDNTGYCKMSNVITFTIGDVGVNLNVAIYGGQATFSWNSDNSSNYSLKVFKEFTWDGDLYENIQPLTRTSYTLGLPKGRYQAYVDCQSMSNVIDFTISEETPILNANVKRNQIYFNWNADNKAKRYNLKIYKGHVWQVDAYEIINDITGTDAAVALPSGTYQAYVDAVGDNYLHMGSIVEFKVGNSNPVLSATVNGNQVRFSWTKDSYAKSYSLKVWNGHAWRSDVYKNQQGITSNEYTMMLPKGKYQAYIDAVEENNIVMGNVIDVIITDDNYIIPILGDINGDGEATIIDATYIQRYNVNMQIPISEETLKKCGDVDNDGEVSVIDATFIQRYDSKIMTPYSIGEPIA